MEKLWLKDGVFTPLTAEQMKSLGDQSAEYAEALNTYRAEKHNEIAELVAKNQEDNKKAIETLKSDLAAMTKSQVEGLTAALKEQGKTIAKMRRVELDASEKNMTIGKQIHKAFKDNPEDVAAWKDGKGGFKFDVKVAGTMLSSTNISGGDVPQSLREPGLNRIARRSTWVLDYIQSGPTSSPKVSWVEQQNPDGTTGGTAEGAAKNQIDFDLVVVEESVKKRTNYIKISDEMLDDIDFMESEVRTELLELLNLDMDDQFLNGDNTGNNMNGIVTQATAYAAGSFAASIDDANNWDVLKTAINQVLVAQHVPSVIFMHPTDVTAMQLTKASDGQYVMPPFQSAEGMEISGLPIVANTGIAVDNFLVMDGMKAKAFIRDGVTLEMGLDGNDFTLNLRTIRAEGRALLRIKGNDTTAFVTGDFTTAKAALETP